MSHEKKTHAAFLDCNINFGGASQGSISLAARLRKYYEITIFDIYNGSEKYRQYIDAQKLELVSVNTADSVQTFKKGNKLQRLFSLMMYIPKLIFMSFRLKNLIEERGIDILWVNNKKSLVFLLPAIVLKKIPVVLYVRGDGGRDTFGFGYMFLVKNFVRHVVSHSKGACSSLKSYGLKNNEISYVPNSVDIGEVLDPCCYADYDGFKLVLPAARVVREKGFIEAVEALKILVDEGMRVRLYLTGVTPFSADNVFLEELKGLIKSYRLDEHVVFLGWRDDIQSVIAYADAMILPSYSEGFPRVVIEAMLLKVPVVVTPVGGVVDVVENKVTGMVIEKKSAASLYSSIAYIYNNKAVCDVMVNNAFLFAQKEFDRSIQTDLFFNVLNNCLLKNTH